MVAASLVLAACAPIDDVAGAASALTDEAGTPIVVYDPDDPYDPEPVVTDGLDPAPDVVFAPHVPEPIRAPTIAPVSIDVVDPIAKTPEPTREPVPEPEELWIGGY